MFETTKNIMLPRVFAIEQDVPQRNVVNRYSGLRRNGAEVRIKSLTITYRYSQLTRWNLHATITRPTMLQSWQPFRNPVPSTISLNLAPMVLTANSSGRELIPSACPEGMLTRSGKWLSLAHRIPTLLRSPADRGNRNSIPDNSLTI